MGSDGSGALAVLKRPYARALIALIAIILVGALFNADGAFFKWGTHRDMLRQASVFGILACGMTVVIMGVVAAGRHPLQSGARRRLWIGLRRADRTLQDPTIHCNHGHDGLRQGTREVRFGR